MFYKSDDTRPSTIPLCLLSLVSIIGISSILWLTRWGIAINNDSTVYIASALNFSRGAGLSEWAVSGQMKPMTHFPPLYPLLLAGAHTLGFDILSTARLFNAFLFGANIFLIGLISLRLTAWRYAPIVAGFLFLFATHLLLIHMLAISESLFILLFLLGIWFFLRHMEDSSFPALILSGLFLGLASLSRYIGVAFIISGIIILISFRKVANRSTFLRTISFISISFSGIVLWVVRNTSHTFSFADRSFGVYPVAKTSLLKGFQTVLCWLMFERNMNYLGYVRFFAFLLILFLLYKYWAPQIKPLHWKQLLANISESSIFIFICLASYITFLFLSILFFDPAIMLDYRILSPVFILSLLLLPLILKQVELNRGIISLFVIWTVFSTAHGIWWGLDRTNSVKWDAYQRFNWQKMDSVHILAGLPKEGAYLTNDPELLYALSGKVPNLLNREKLCTLMTHGSPAPMTEKKPDTYLVFFKQKVSKPFLPSRQDLREIPGLKIISDSPHIYICRFDR